MRRITRKIHVGSVEIGGGKPLSIQTMAKAKPSDVDGIVSQLLAAKKMGCDVGRIAIPDENAVSTIPEIRKRTGMPIIADIHFDYRLAIESARVGVDGLRVNPGNLGGEKAMKAVVEAAKKAQIPIRVGVNGGSLPKKAMQPGRSMAQAMVETALEMVDSIQAMGFYDLKVSLKAFDVAATVEANRLFSSRCDVPLHLGITEAGPPPSGVIRSVSALSILLSEGIGDTLRISLSAPPVEEVRCARILLRALGLRSAGVVVSCPTCGRTQAEVVTLAERIDEYLCLLGLDLVVAVMGCEVNGPGEAREADLGVAFGPKGEGLLFESGKIVAKVRNEQLDQRLMERLDELHRGGRR